jgi:hypothetical protein
MIDSLSPEKAGVGGSTPSLATIISKHLPPIGHFPNTHKGAGFFDHKLTTQDQGARRRSPRQFLAPIDSKGKKS